ncbi:MAG: LysR family transcriptional regulator [Moraxellaceae bacterium]|nr:LysR family transcriptional regulator [Moraxellaceae bacterium]MBP9730476.1 LysR family transcriptional regulator [Moraxellaceae bacterium]HQV40444.1 LysR family transcriptional regulator [Moraxellaceae bacterium]HQX89238.1 LysR family transcriptional regulator [Moraxellaceae bacterium]
MDTAALSAFLEVARTASFSQAAEHLHLTQPAVSKRISGLESSLGVSLFDRVGRQISLTEAGRTLLPRAQHLLLDMEDMKRAVGNLSGPVTGTLKIGTSHHIGLHRLPPTLRAFSTEYRHVRLDLRFIDSEEAYEAVLSGELELGIVTLPPAKDDRLIAREIWEDPLAFVAGNDHPLTKMQKITLAELTRHQAILPSSSTFTRQIASRLFQESGLEMQVSMTTNYLETIKMMASIGLGWSVLPASMADHELEILNIDGITLKRSLGVVYHPRRILSRAAQAMLELLIPEKTS